jgi:glycosyltransferase involved in cell wall biosynthesis
MKVVIFATYFAPELGGGVARYEREVLPRLVPVLVAAGCEVSVLVLKDGKGLEAAKGVHIIRLPVGRDQPYKRILYDQVYGSMHSRGADVLLSLEYWFPILPLWSKRNIVVIHDAHAELAWIQRRKHLFDREFPAILYWHAVYTKAARASDRVLTDSKFAAKELSQVFRIPREKIAPIYCGVDTRHLRPILDHDTLERVRKRYSLPDQYYLFVGPSSGDKNLRFILQTFMGMDPTDPRALPVVVTSSRPVASPEADLLAQLEASGRGHSFHFAGHVETGDLSAVYSAARALIFPSLHEGFGLPPVEAMACGTPVLATNCTSVPEVVGDAAILIDPGNPQSLLDALVQVNIESMRQDLICKGFERVKMFTWDRTVQQIAEEVLAGRKGSIESRNGHAC